LHGHDVLGLESQSVVRAALAGDTRPLARATPRRETLALGPGVQDVRAGVPPSALPTDPHRSPLDLSFAVVEPAPALVLPLGPHATLLTSPHRSRSPDAPIPRGPSRLGAERTRSKHAHANPNRPVASRRSSPDIVRPKVIAEFNWENRLASLI